MSTVTVTFSFDDNKTYEAESGLLLSKICELAGYPQDLVCGGKQKCGKCAVRIIDADGEEKTVLSCATKVTQPITVEKIFNRADRKVHVLTSNTALDCNINPSLGSITLEEKDINPDHCMSFEKALRNNFKIEMNYNVVKKLSNVISPDEPNRKFTFVTFNSKAIDVNFDDDDSIYGLAIDIGSTTVAAYLYDMNTATLLGTHSSLNGQTALGADVISRIQYTIDNYPDGAETMQKMVCDTINKLIGEIREENQINTDRIYHVVLCGNSTMQHLFLGLYPKYLGKAPFASTTHDIVEIDARDVPLDLNPYCKVTFLPLLGGYVGADTTGVLISLPDDGEARLAMDLGTNGELACGTNDRYNIASTACGPALEGAGLSCGMRAADGAIQYFKIDPEKKDISLIDVIGDVEPTGICGSGIIDILAELIRNGIINRKGKMLSREEYEEKFGADALSARLEKREGGKYGMNSFLIYRSETSEVYFTQMDSRAVQLAKAAIMAGCELLIGLYGKGAGSLKEVCLAGAFGNYLDTENAQYIGLFPKIEGVPTRSIGNGAGTGVQMYLLDKGSIKKCRNIQKNVYHVELNELPDFNTVYARQMDFINAPKDPDDEEDEEDEE
ncbi:MAG: DUF4445 domain-containing protein [Eubacteriaceae bacterium]|nr:DUF4445 domain-containing protein [Eubacteriaceae bacterium]